MTVPARAVAMRDAFLGEIHARMAERPEIFFLSADFGSPRLDAIRRDYPERFVNVGIAEQNLVNLSLGLALEGFCVFAYAIAPLLLDDRRHAPQSSSLLALSLTAGTYAGLAAAFALEQLVLSAAPSDAR